jgi:hypothetical protein
MRRPCYKRSVSDYRRLVAAVRPHLGLLASAIAAMVVLSAATGAFSWLVGPLFQFVFKGGAQKIINIKY